MARRSRVNARWAWASLPSFGDEQRTPFSRTLYFLALGLMAMSVIPIVQSCLYGWTGEAWTMGAENLFLIAALWFNHQGKLEWATGIICFSELICGLLLIALFGIEFKDEMMFLFPLMLVIAAILLSWRSYLRFSALVLVSVGATGIILARTGHRTHYHNVITVVNILCITVIAVGLLARSLKGALTEAKRAEQKLRAAHDLLAKELEERTRAEAEIAALNHDLINAQEEERKRIARELHDDISQQIAVLGISLSLIKRQIPEDRNEAREQVERSHQRLLQMAEGIRHLSHELHPAMLETLGLASALKTYCAEFQAIAGVKVEFRADESFADIPAAPALGIFRIAQAALQNVWKHSGVTESAVLLARSATGLELRVSDAGAGFDPAESCRRGGLGLVSMRERARLLGGALKIESAKGRGTTITAAIPITS